MPHAPAPWTFGEDGWVTDGDGRPIFQVVDGEHQVGNGTLGAAGPALLETCKIILSGLEANTLDRRGAILILKDAIKLAVPEPQPQVLPPRPSGRIDFFGLTGEEGGQP